MTDLEKKKIIEEGFETLYFGEDLKKALLGDEECPFLDYEFSGGNMELYKLYLVFDSDDGELNILLKSPSDDSYVSNLEYLGFNFIMSKDEMMDFIFDNIGEFKRLKSLGEMYSTETMRMTINDLQLVIDYHIDPQYSFREFEEWESDTDVFNDEILAELKDGKTSEEIVESLIQQYQYNDNIVVPDMKVSFEGIVEKVKESM